MTMLAVWAFGAADTAEEVAVPVQAHLPADGSDPAARADLAVVRWPSRDRRPSTRRVDDVRDAAAGPRLDDGFWGLLFGQAFFAPLLGLALDGDGRAPVNPLVRVGVHDAFLDEVRGVVVPGTSALVALGGGAALDRLDRALAPREPELVHVILSRQEEAALRHVFGG